MCLRTKGCSQPSPHSERFSSFSGHNVFSSPSAAYLEHCTCGARPVAKSLTDVPNGTSRRACVASVRRASRGASVCVSVCLQNMCVMSISNWGSNPGRKKRTCTLALRPTGACSVLIFPGLKWPRLEAGHCTCPVSRIQLIGGILPHPPCVHGLRLDSVTSNRLGKMY